MSDEMVGVDIGLEVLCHVNKPAIPLTLREIADVCDCSAEYVRQIQDKAIRKLKQKRRLKEHL